MSYRSTINESDFSAFANIQVSEIGQMVVISPKGRTDKPVLIQGEENVVKLLGKPSADYPSVFEAISFCRESSCYIVSAIGTGALYGGISVKEGAVASLTSGIADPDNYTFTDNTISHILCTASPWDSTYYGNVITKGGSKFRLTLYDLTGTVYSEIKYYDYSLIREKDGFGKSLYYDDVFNDDNYIKFIYNASTTASSYTLLSGTTKYNFDGGSRGTTPSSANITTAWNLFQSVNKYPGTIVMDVLGDHAGDINTLIQTYNSYAQGLSIIPLGKTVAQMTSYRSSLSLDTDDVALYCNWTKIKDSYNNSYAWISNMGAIGKCWARMDDVYDGLSPAGINENNHGGQIADWTPVEVELDFSDTNLQTLDEAQINPIIFDEVYGMMAYGDKTLQATLSDTSYIGTRRLYKLIQKNIMRQILRRQEFKNNDSYHRFKAKSMTEDMLKPIVALQLLREVAVICDETNNDDTALEQRKFYLTILVRVTPNSQFVTLNFIRLSQTQILSEFLP